MTSIYLPTQPFNYSIDYDRNEDDFWKEVDKWPSVNIDDDWTEVDEDIKTSIYLPTELFTKIIGYCGESYEEKRDRLWRSIQPKIRRCIYTDDAILIVYDKTRGKSLEWILTIEDRLRISLSPASKIEHLDMDGEWVEGEFFPQHICCIWTTEEWEEKAQAGRYNENDELVY